MGYEISRISTGRLAFIVFKIFYISVLMHGLLFGVGKISKPTINTNDI